MPTKQLANIKKYRKLMDSWFKQVDQELVARAQHGEDVEGMGWKLVTGRTRRKYRDEKIAQEKLSLVLPEDEIFEVKLKSPNQLKKSLSAVGIKGKLQAAFIKTLVYFPPGRPTLAPTGDNRLAVPVELDPFDEDEDGLE